MTILHSLSQAESELIDVSAELRETNKSLGEARESLRVKVAQMEGLLARRGGQH